MDLDGQLALVTGASRGIGRAIAMELGRLGSVVAGTATTEEGATAITEALAAAGLRGCGLRLDVNDAESVEQSLATLRGAHGAPVILVNNAGVTRDTLAVRMKDADWDEVLATDLTGVFRVSRGVLKDMMKARYGRIVNVTSVVGSAGNPGQINYAAAKAGVAGMTRALARELASRNITVNCVAPGLIDTDMTRGLTDDQKHTMLGQIPLGRLGQAEEVAAAVAFLASPRAAYITGTTLHVNGGMYMS